jgi:hypothetical protein
MYGRLKDSSREVVDKSFEALSVNTLKKASVAKLIEHGFDQVIGATDMYCHSHND